MVKRRYIPNRGDLIWMDFMPTRGHEQSGRRPALILSPQKYNKLVGLALVVPITSKQKGYNFEVVLSTKAKIQGVILSDQIRNIDWRIRKAKYIENIDAEIITNVLENLQALLS